jgi:GTPase SAR1 family protein
MKIKLKRSLTLTYLLVGHTGVGKTCILNRFVNKEFIFNTDSTVGHLS